MQVMVILLNLYFRAGRLNTNVINVRHYYIRYTRPRISNKIWDVVFVSCSVF